MKTDLVEFAEPLHVPYVKHTKSCRKIRKILSLRGVNSINDYTSFLQNDLESLSDPFFLENMDQVVKLLLDAIFTKKNIAMYSPHNLESITSVATLKDCMDNLSTSSNVLFGESYHNSRVIPKNIWTGVRKRNESIFFIFGDVQFEPEHLEEVIKSNIQVIFVNESKKNIDLTAQAIQLTKETTSKHFDNQYFTTNTIVLKLVQAIHEKMGYNKSMILPFLDLTAIGLGARYASVIKDNRILMHHGLKRLNSKPRPGLRFLINRLNIKNLTTRDIVFKLAPHLNSSIRLHSPNKTLNLLCEKNNRSASQLTQEIIDSNAQRKRLQERDINLVMQYITSYKSTDHCHIIFNKHLNENLLGIVASKIAQRTHKPTIIMTSNQDGTIIGSGRSFADYDLYDALNNSLHFLLQFGGHKKAIGFTLKEKNLLPFKRMMTDYINQTIEMSTIIEKRRLTHYVTLEQISLPLWKELTKLEPYGPGNMRPIFQSKITLDKSTIQLIANKHIKIKTRNRHGQHISFLGYNMGSSLKDIELATSLECEFVIESYLNKDNRTMVCTIKSIKDING